MSQKHFNTETETLEISGYLPTELERFHAVVMDEDTWYNEIRRPGKNYAVRVNRFLDGLLAILKSWEEKEPCLIYPYLYILHVDLTEDKKTALVSLQRTHGYEFVFENVEIPFEQTAFLLLDVIIVLASRIFSIMISIYRIRFSVDTIDISY